MTVTNLYIDSILYKYCANYLGCFSSNNLPLKKVKKSSLVCNLSKNTEEGTHFVAIIIDDEKIFYIDSFGIPPYISGIISFIKNQHKKLYYLHNQIQPKKSVFCAFYAIMFVLSSENKDIPLLKFDLKKIYLNDEICIHNICEIIKKINH